MTLAEWAEQAGKSDREIAEAMTEWLATAGIEDQVSVPAVQKYRTGRTPKQDRMRAVFGITEGWVQPNDFFGIDPLGVVS